MPPGLVFVQFKPAVLQLFLQLFLLPFKKRHFCSVKTDLSLAGGQKVGCSNPLAPNCKALCSNKLRKANFLSLRPKITALRLRYTWGQ